MRTQVALVVAIIVLTAASPVASTGGQAGASQPATVITYDEFMTSSADQRRHRFQTLSAENKARIVKTHAEQWLQRNRARLTSSEAAVFDEVVASITPELYQRRIDAEKDGRESSLLAKMRCRVSPDDVREATGIFGEKGSSTSSRPTWTYLNKAQCWLDWILEGLVAATGPQARATGTAPAVHGARAVDSSAALTRTDRV